MLLVPAACSRCCCSASTCWAMRCVPRPGAARWLTPRCCTGRVNLSVPYADTAVRRRGVDFALPARTLRRHRRRIGRRQDPGIPRLMGLSPPRARIGGSRAARRQTSCSGLLGAGGARPRGAHDLPGSDDRADAAPAHRRPARRSAGAHRGMSWRDARRRAAAELLEQVRMTDVPPRLRSIRTSCRAACASAS